MERIITFTQADQGEMEGLKREIGSRFCRRCEYCQPCTQEIPISLAVRYPSLANRLPPGQVFSGFVADAMERAAQCTKCGDCEERCPYGLPIQEMLEDYAAQYQRDKAKQCGGVN